MTVMSKMRFVASLKPKETLNSKCTSINGLQEVNVVSPVLVLHLIAHTCPIIALAISLTAELLSTTLISIIVSLHPYLKFYQKSSENHLQFAPFLICITANYGQSLPCCLWTKYNAKATGTPYPFPTRSRQNQHQQKYISFTQQDS